MWSNNDTIFFRGHHDHNMCGLIGSSSMRFLRLPIRRLQFGQRHLNGCDCSSFVITIVGLRTRQKHMIEPEDNLAGLGIPTSCIS